MFWKKKTKKQIDAKKNAHIGQSTEVTEPDVPNSDGWYTVVSGDVWMKKHEHLISLIYSNIRLNDFHQNMYYTTAIRNFCRLVQALPASEYHHHSYPGGLIEHTLQVAKNAVIYSRRFMFSENGKEVELEEQFDLFMYCCFTAALMHDVGKIVTDFDLVGWDGQLNPNGTKKATILIPVNPLQADIGSEYMWRYCSSRNKLAHESAAASLMQSIVPIEGLYWLRSCSTLWQQWFHTLAGRKPFGGDIAEVIEYCDSKSVEQSMATNTSKDGSSNKNVRHTLAERFVIAIRQLIESSALPLNRPGAAGFVSGDYIYLVSQRTIEAATPIVKNSGGTSIPKNVVNIFSMLCDAGIAERHPITNDVIHTLHIRLNTGDGWDGELTFLKFPIKEIDPNGALGLVSADIDITDKTEEKGHNAKKAKDTQVAEKDTDGSDQKPESINDLLNMFSAADMTAPKADNKDNKETNILDQLSAIESTLNIRSPKKPSKTKPKAKAPVAESNENNDKPGIPTISMESFASDDQSTLSSTQLESPNNGSQSEVDSFLSDSLDMSDFDSLEATNNEAATVKVESTASSQDVGDSFLTDTLDMSDFDSLEVTNNQATTDKVESIATTQDVGDSSLTNTLDMSDFIQDDAVPEMKRVALSQDNSKNKADSSLLDTLDISDFERPEEDTSIDEFLSSSCPSTTEESLDRTKKGSVKITTKIVDSIIKGDKHIDDPSNPEASHIESQITDLLNDQSPCASPSPSSTESDVSKLLDNIGINKPKLDSVTPTNYGDAITEMINWLDNGLANRTIKFNKVSNSTNYVFNTKYGVFVCIYTLIDEYNKSNPSSEIKIKRIERVLHELESQRLIHCSNTNSQLRVAHLNLPNKPPISLKGIFLKRESLVKMRNNTSYVDAHTCLIEP
ncbi:MobH family relaxase [Photobacterium damselae]|uniref:MobH family relaxase n=1 Tax=Photobacterium damselae TaxID=38293 RepID=UPI004067FBEB